MNEKFKIRARKNRADQWQEFTGVRSSTLEEMVVHCKRHLLDMPYEFGIFKLGYIFSPVVNKNVLKFVLVKVIREKI